MRQWDSVLSKPVQLTRSKNGGLGSGAPSRWAIFVIFLAKNSHFIAIWIKFRKFLEPHEKTILLRLETKLKN